jgi:predicted RNase H-like HicB family nuclease/predicted RNA binding protein YcfA (HicA-like mRNA interferase family)
LPLESNGWRFARQNGASHRQFVKPGVARTITVVGEGVDDVGAGLLGRILREAGLKRGGMIMGMKRYSVVLERGENNWGAYSPDVPGCFAVGDTVEEVRQRFASALEFHFEGMRLEGFPIPEPSTQVEYVEVAA